jgi:hypothetical protein
MTFLGLGFTPDNRAVAASFCDHTLQIWETATGGRRTGYALDDKYALIRGMIPQRQFAFSPDGRLLAHGHSSGAVVVRAADTGKELARLAGHRGLLTAVAFAPDSKTLATGSADSTVLLWDVTALRERLRPKGARLGAGELEAAWEALGRRDAAKAYAALCRLADAPGSAVPYLRERLRPVAAAEGAKAERLIPALDSAQFRERERARAELLKLGAAAVPALREALKRKLSLEAERRVRDLLGRLTQERLVLEDLRYLRAVEALERAGTAEARAVLRRLAAGSRGAPPTRAAQAALDRLGAAP